MAYKRLRLSINTEGYEHLTIKEVMELINQLLKENRSKQPLCKIQK